MVRKDYRCHATIYYSSDRVEVVGQEFGEDLKIERRKGEIIVFLTRCFRKKTLDEAKVELRKMWKEEMENFPGEMIEAWINDDEEYPSKRGVAQSEFSASNLDKFKKGSQAAMGTPF